MHYALRTAFNWVPRVDPGIESAGERPDYREPFINQLARHTGG